MLATGWVAHEIPGTDLELLAVAVHLRATGEDEIKLLLVRSMPVPADGCAGGDDGDVDEVAPAGEAGCFRDAKELDRPFAAMRLHARERQRVKIASAERHGGHLYAPSPKSCARRHLAASVPIASLRQGQRGVHPTAWPKL